MDGPFPCLADRALWMRPEVDFVGGPPAPAPHNIKKRGGTQKKRPFFKWVSLPADRDKKKKGL
ncbi:hypothetical protein NKJ90_27095, partial [Mesorhizobium sp. M0051]|uniref:hypothetical protein n=1 Tax=Mesorhizobium sp. M0051 TaxID=2956862 RepID=UPI003339EDEF